jgi:hypothetical protein
VLAPKLLVAIITVSMCDAHQIVRRRESGKVCGLQSDNAWMYLRSSSYGSNRLRLNVPDMVIMNHMGHIST